MKTNSFGKVLTVAGVDHDCLRDLDSRSTSTRHQLLKHIHSIETVCRACSRSILLSKPTTAITTFFRIGLM